VGITVLLLVLGIPGMVTGSYLGCLGALARPRQRGANVPDSGGFKPCFTFVVPAHDEAEGIQRTVKSLLAVDYPKDKFSVLVVADNCSDQTKERAEGAGARVLERVDELRRGKGYALELAFQTLLAEGISEAIVVVDADTDVSANLLLAMAARLSAGELAMQAHYGVRNVDDSWRTRLMDYAFTLFHGVRSTARERMGLSSGLRGNGMAFTPEALRRVPYQSYSLVEDVEYGIELGLHGIRVAYVGEAEVLGEMVTGSQSSESQRLRWEQGRSSLVARYGFGLLRRGIRERNAMLLDLALDVLTPPLTKVVLRTGVGLLFATGAVATGVASPIAVVPWLASATGIGIYLARGVQLAPGGGRVLIDLVHVPKYIIWKLLLSNREQPKDEETWVRTARKGEAS
jgi:1,2-diacylglycerol 3-beta-glucosyltransferase